MIIIKRNKTKCYCFISSKQIQWSKHQGNSCHFILEKTTSFSWALCLTLKFPKVAFNQQNQNTRTKQFLDLGIKDTILKCHMARVHLKNNKWNYVLKEHFSFHCCLLLFWRICQTQISKSKYKGERKK